MNGKPFAISDKLRNAGRSISLMIREGLITEAELTGYRWTMIGRALAVAIVEGRASITVNESDPLPPPPGFWLDDLLFQLPDHVLADLVQLPGVKTYAASNLLHANMISVLEKVGVVTVRRGSSAIDWAVPREAVLDFFHRYPDRIPAPHELQMRDRIRAADKLTLDVFLDDLRLTRMYHEAEPHTDIWDIL